MKLKAYRDEVLGLKDCCSAGLKHLDVGHIAGTASIFLVQGQARERDESIIRYASP